jgi:hypothetical protein
MPYLRMADNDNIRMARVSYPLHVRLAHWMPWVPSVKLAYQVP